MLLSHEQALNRKHTINFDDSDWIVVLVGAALGAFVQLYVEKKYGRK